MDTEIHSNIIDASGRHWLTWCVVGPTGRPLVTIHFVNGSVEHFYVSPAVHTPRAELLERAKSEIANH